MTEIAKNIKKIRNAKKITQEELAVKINVTRQAVSNWETGKTQPDIETLQAIAEAFEIGFEELIYGRKYIRNDGKAKDAVHLSTIKIILALAGSIFIAVGLVFIFLEFWEDFPEVLKVILSVIPLLCAQAFSVFVLTKKSDYISWKECASAVLAVGAVSSIALINSVLDIHCGFQNCLIIDTLMILPAIFLFDAVMPLAVCSFFSLYFSFNGFGLISAIIVIICFVFSFYHRKNTFDVRFKISSWLCLLSAGFISVGGLSGYGYSGSEMFFIPMMIFPFVLGAAYIKGDSNFNLPLKVISQAGSAFILCFTSFMCTSLRALALKSIIPILISFLVGIVLYAVMTIIKVKNTDENKVPAVLSLVSSVICLSVYFYYTFIDVKNTEHFNYTDYAFIDVQGKEGFYYIFALLGAITGVCRIVEGIKEISFLKINLGLVIILAQLILILMINGNDLLLGIMLLLFGIILITINSVLAYRVRKKNNQIPEVLDNEV